MVLPNLSQVLQYKQYSHYIIIRAATPSCSGVLQQGGCSQAINLAAPPSNVQVKHRANAHSLQLLWGRAKT